MKLSTGYTLYLIVYDTQSSTGTKMKWIDNTMNMREYCAVRVKGFNFEFVNKMYKGNIQLEEAWD